MADFAYIPTSYESGPLYVNLDYVVRIYTGLDPREPTELVLVDGTTIQMSRSEGGKLIAQLNLCCKPRPVDKPQTPSGAGQRKGKAVKASGKRASARG